MEKVEKTACSVLGEYGVWRLKENQMVYILKKTEGRGLTKGEHAKTEGCREKEHSKGKGRTTTRKQKGLVTKPARKTNLWLLVDAEKKGREIGP